MRVKVPGKLLLLGEYSVLEGGSAMVAAVNRYALCESSESDREPSDVVREVCLEAGDASAARKLVIDTGTFYDTAHRKFGIGSSAAVAVSTAVYVQGQVTISSYQAALAGHRRAAGGVGSGVDIAASFYGGIIVTSTQPAPVEALKTKVDGLYLAIFFLDRSASTKNMVQACRASTNWKSLTQVMQATTQAGIDAWRQGHAVDFIESSREYGRYMKDLGISAGVPIFTPEMEALSQLSNKYGAAAKPSGAGGGDVALVWALDPQVLDRIHQESSLHRLDLQISSTGAQIL